MCFRSKNLYNEALYVIRQEFFKTGKYIPYRKMNFEFKTHENYKACLSQPANCTLRSIDKAWKSYFSAIKDWKINPDKYLGMPKIPKYLPKDGRYLWMIPNNSVIYVPEKNEIYFRVKLLNDFRWFSKCCGRLIQVRFVPKGTCYIMEIVYEIDSPDVEQEPDRIAAIDIGVDNLITMSNNIGLSPIIVNGKIIKSINQYYNKRIATLKSSTMKRNGLSWSKQMSAISFKRSCRIRNYLHNTSAYVVKWCLANNVDTLVVGRNKRWKQGTKRMQNFSYIPYSDLIDQLKYKCENNGIRFVEVTEEYTSGTSYLDEEIPCKENYDISRRISRGLFQSGNTLINADVNASLQIMRKAFPNSFTGYGIEVDLTPVIINAVA